MSNAMGGRVMPHKRRVQQVVKNATSPGDAVDRLVYSLAIEAELDEAHVRKHPHGWNVAVTFDAY